MKGKMHDHKHPRAAHAKGGKADNPMKGDWADDKAPTDVYAGAGSNGWPRQAQAWWHGCPRCNRQEAR